MDADFGLFAFESGFVVLTYCYLLIPYIAHGSLRLNYVDNTLILLDSS